MQHIDSSSLVCFTYFFIDKIDFNCRSHETRRSAGEGKGEAEGGDRKVEIREGDG